MRHSLPSPFLTLTLCVASWKVTSHSRLLLYHENFGEDEWFWNFLLGVWWRALRQRKDSQPKVSDPQLSEQPCLYPVSSNHSINVLCICLAMHIKTTTDVTSTYDMAPGFMGASNMTRDRIYTDMIINWI